MNQDTRYRARPQGGSAQSGTPFGARLRVLIGDQSTSEFARRVGLSESLIRKYLKGSEPSLSKAWQIAHHTRTSLYWLAGAPEPLPDVDLDTSGRG